MVYSVDLREKAVSLVGKGKPKEEVAELLEIGIATLYRWLKKKAAGESLDVQSQSMMVYYHHHLRSHYGTNITWVRQNDRGGT